MKSATAILFLGLCGLALIVSRSTGTALAETPPNQPVRVVAVEGPDREARQPQVAVDQEGRIYVTFGVGNVVRCARSDDRGRTFAVSTVGSVDALSLGMRRGPRIAVAGNAIVVSAIGGREGKGRDGDLLAWRSTNAGKTWAGPVRVNTIEASAREGLHGMAAGPDGSVYCAWLDLRVRGTQVYGARSRDGGASWEPDRLVYRSPDGSVCQCCHPSVAYGPDGTLSVMWRNLVRGARDLYLVRSPDGGATFGAAEKLGRGTWNLSACPMDGGSVSAGPGGLIETAWMRESSMFTAEPGEPERRLGRGVQGWTAIGSAGPYSVWLANRPGRLLAQVPGRRDPLTLAEGAIDPVVAAGPGGRGLVIAAWETKEGIFATTLDRIGPDATK
jgi:hypothetical protein